jgi:phytoene dehydrogenase-like protein/ligand-binding SRPBCC domain-containing protein
MSGERPPPDVVVVGGGLAGLASACNLGEAGADVLLIEREDAVGGRVRSDRFDGFILDRGFQVLLTAYPRASELLDFDALDLRRFHPGARIYTHEGWQRVDDPVRRPRSLAMALGTRAATLADKLRILRLRRRVTRLSLPSLLDAPARTAGEQLEDDGFSRRVRRRFFEPFLRGVFLERELRTSSRFFLFVMRMFATGDAAVPARGMQAIADQLAARLPAGTIETGARVARVEAGERPRVVLEDGRAIEARAVVLAMPRASAAALLGEPAPDEPSRDVTCVYYSASSSPVGRPTLVLDGEDEGPVNNLSVMSDVAPTYAPPGQALISATVLGDPPIDDAELDRRCRAQLTRWFGEEVATWRTLRIYRVENALPDDAAMTLEPRALDAQQGVYLAGDHLATPSIEGAITSGLATAAAIETTLELHANRPELPTGRPTFSRSFDLDASVEAVAAFHAGAGALAHLQPPLSGTRFERVDPLGEGSVTEFTMGRWPARLRWRAVHRDVLPGRGFTDVQERGPMRSWIHRHEYRRLGPSRTRVSDRIWYEHPTGLRGLLTRALFHPAILSVLFRYRAWATGRALSAGRAVHGEQ